MTSTDSRRSVADRIAEHWKHGELVYPHDSTGTAFWPPSDYTPVNGEDSQWSTSAGHGTVYAATKQYSRTHPPKHFALVELDEGFRMLGLLTGDVDLDDLIGSRVATTFSPPDEYSGSRHPIFELLSEDHQR
ncbi:OB-fold domain-containing protein [Citricoccus sp. NPDC055426]|uniref:Zn-ribbon domain-containing OB-fold protein n=1 Tax=Citricoccus sp. NPDC055426 TaxID=3155536 RepID=UPI00341F10CC